MKITRKTSKPLDTPEQPVTKPTIATTPVEHENAAILHNAQETEHQETRLYHKLLSEEYKSQGLRKLSKRHKALARYHEALANEHQKAAKAHEKLVTS
jgi:predicted nucleotidyltransferase